MSQPDGAAVLARRLARYFGRIPHLHAAALSTSWQYDPPRPVIFLVMSEEALDLPMSEGVAAMEHAQSCALRVGRLIGTRGVRTTFLTRAWRDTHGLGEDDFALFVRNAAPGEKASAPTGVSSP